MVGWSVGQSGSWLVRQSSSPSIGRLSNSIPWPNKQQDLYFQLILTFHDSKLIGSTTVGWAISFPGNTPHVTAIGENVSALVTLTEPWNIHNAIVWMTSCLTNRLYFKKTSRLLQNIIHFSNQCIRYRVLVLIQTHLTVYDMIVDLRILL